MLNTSCKDCVFAKYDKNTQVGCDFNNRISIYAKRDKVVPAYDEEKEFFVIDGTRCLAYRDGKWGEKHKKEKSLYKIARQELTQKIDIIVLFQEGDTTDSLLTTLNSALAQSTPVNSVIVVNNQKTIKTPVLNVLMIKTMQDVKWNLVDIIEENADRLRAIDLGASKCKGMFYGVFSAGYEIPTNYVQSIDEAIVDRLEMFYLLTPYEDGEGLTVALGFHKHRWVGGNEFRLAKTLEKDFGKEEQSGDPENIEIGGGYVRNIIDKANIISKEFEMPNFIKRLEDVCSPQT